jgi:hypothetical protein
MLSTAYKMTAADHYPEPDESSLYLLILSLRVLKQTMKTKLFCSY